MRKVVNTLLVAVLVLGGLTISAFAKDKVAIISKGYQHEFWRTVEAGARQAAKELDVEMSFIGPEKESEIGKQVSMVENELIKQPTALMLAALDQNALRPISERIVNSGIPLVTFDSNIAGGIETSFVATDNIEVGVIAAKEMIRLIGETGTVGVIAHNAGTSTAIQRTKGFIDEMKKYPGIKLLSTKYSDGDKIKAINITQDIVTANPDIKGVYGTNEGAVVGVGRAISEMGKNDSIVVIGVDSSSEEINLLKEGAIDGMVVQSPFNMGYLALKIAIKAAHGEKVEKRVDTGAILVTRENLNDEKIQKILFPFGKNKK